MHFDYVWAFLLGAVTALILVAPFVLALIKDLKRIKKEQDNSQRIAFNHAMEED